MKTAATAHLDQKRLVFLTQWFEPEPAQKGLAFAQRMGELGFDVEVVTGFPNYPGGKLYKGYRIRPLIRENMGGVRVTRLALFPSHSESKIGRVLNYLSFFISASMYLVFFLRRADLIYAYHPPLTVGIAAMMARIFRRTRVVLDVQDMWPDTLRATGMVTSERVLSVVGKVARWTWKSADHVIVLSRGFRDLLLKRGVSGTRVSVVLNWADELGASSELPTSEHSRHSQVREFRVLFAGNIGPAQALDSVLDAAAILGAEHPGIMFDLLGAGIDEERLKTRARNEALHNIRFLSRVPRGEVGSYLVAADCLLVHLKADPLFAITIPSKTQAYMAAGKPIVMCVEGDAADLVRAAQSGVVVPPEDPKALAKAIAELASRPRTELAKLGDNGRAFYDARLSFARGTQRIADILNHAIADPDDAKA